MPGRRHDMSNGDTDVKINRYGENGRQVVPRVFHTGGGKAFVSIENNSQGTVNIKFADEVANLVNPSEFELQHGETQNVALEDPDTPREYDYRILEGCKCDEETRPGPWVEIP
jgi:hypothetical protein